MCGITGVIVEDGSLASPALYDALLALQHRGQDAAGIVTEDMGRLCLHKDNGMVRDVFQQQHMSKLMGSMGIGHVRYPTAGSSSCSEAQPFYVSAPFGITMAHNGNLVNTSTLQQSLRKQMRHLNTNSDSEVLLNIFAGALHDSLSLRQAAKPPSPTNTAAGIAKRSVSAPDLSGMAKRSVLEPLDVEQHLVSANEWPGGRRPAPPPRPLTPSSAPPPPSPADPKPPSPSPVTDRDRHRQRSLRRQAPALPQGWGRAGARASSAASGRWRAGSQSRQT